MPTKRMSNMEVICQGWLTKSPPERKLYGLLATFRKAKWRRRYFVLHKPASSLPDTYALDYYRDASLTKKVSHVDLEQCEQVVASLESAFYQYLFSIRTKHKGRDRTYYLATATEDEMTRWVDCLCHVCNLKQEEEEEPAEDDDDDDIPPMESPAPPPPERMDSIPASPPPGWGPGARVSPSAGRIVNKRPSEDERGYIPLDECTSGPTETDMWDANAKRDSLASIPDAPPPPPPEKRVTADEDFYDSPPVRVMPNSKESMELYNVPPVRNAPRRRREESSVDSCYDIPPLRDCTRDSVRTSSSSGYRTSGDTYDIPPRRSPENDDHLLETSPRPRSNTDHFSRVTADPYDVPPVRSSSERDVSSEREEIRSPPPRPPKTMSPETDRVDLDMRPNPGRIFFPSTTSSVCTTSSVYDIPPPSGGRGSVTDFDVYDFPRTLEQADVEQLPPAPPQPCTTPGLKQHRYVNAATGYITDTDPSGHRYVNSPPLGGVLPPLQEVDRLRVHDHDPTSFSDTSSTGSVELNQAIPAPRQQSLVMAGYADMAGQSYTPMNEHVSPYSVPPPSAGRLSHDVRSTYSVPPSARNGVYSQMNNSSSAYTELPSGPSRPVITGRSVSVMTRVPPYSGLRLPEQTDIGDLADTYSCNIVQTPRSRSFKKKSPVIPPRKMSAPPVPPVSTNHIQLPQRMKAMQSSSDSESGSDADDDPSSTYDLPPVRSTRPLSQTPPPPLPHQRQKGEIQYLDLDLESSSTTSDKASTQPHSPPAGSMSPTEYREIDFVRTAALSETKRVVESARRGSGKGNG